MKQEIIAARDHWSTGQKAIFDVKVFNPYAKSNQKFTLVSCFSDHNDGVASTSFVVLPIALINSVHPWDSIASKLHSSTSCIL